MTDIEILKDKYFVRSTPSYGQTVDVPVMFKDCKVTPLIDGVNYNVELQKMLDTVGKDSSSLKNANDFIFIANWWLGLVGGRYVAGPSSATISSGPDPNVIYTRPYCLDRPGGTSVLIDILKKKAQKGVNVRVLGWVSFGVMSSEYAKFNDAAKIAEVNSLTMKSILDLRSEASLTRKAMLNVISHTAGAAHSKLVVIGKGNQAVGFTGGIDFVENRWTHSEHPLEEKWHDVVAMVEGPAVQAFYDFFRDMWNENKKRPARVFKFEGRDMYSFLPGTTDIPPLRLSTDSKGNHHVQGLRTIPTFNYKFYNRFPRNDPISFSPNAPLGLFEFRSAMRKALRNAEIYIYIEDQAFWSAEILDWINVAVRSKPSLRVILLSSGGPDPSDPLFSDAYLCKSINHSLLDKFTLSNFSQVRMYRRLGDYVRKKDSHDNPVSIRVTKLDNMGFVYRLFTDYKLNKAIEKNELVIERYMIKIGSNEFYVVGNESASLGDSVSFIVRSGAIGGLPVVGDYELYYQVGIVIHSKTTLVDDQWACIGSANITRRSLYTDLEHCICVLDEKEDLVNEYRRALWADHFRHPTPGHFDDIDTALHSWESTWGIPGGASPPRPPCLVQIKLPIHDVPLSADDEAKYDMYHDVDSREPWGGLFP